MPRSARLIRVNAKKLLVQVMVLSSSSLYCCYSDVNRALCNVENVKELPNLVGNLTLFISKYVTL